jgi:subtilisin family serine protease
MFVLPLFAASLVFSAVDVDILSKGTFSLSEATAVLTGVAEKFQSNAQFQNHVRSAAEAFALDPLTTMQTPAHVLFRIHADHDVSTASVKAWESHVAASSLASPGEVRKPFVFGEYLGAHPETNPSSNPHVHHFMSPATPEHLVTLARLPQIESFIFVPAELKISPDLWTLMNEKKEEDSPPHYVDLLVGLTDGHLSAMDEAAEVSRAVQSSINALPSVTAVADRPRPHSGAGDDAEDVILPTTSHHATDRLKVSNVSRGLLFDVVRTIALHAEVTWIEDQPEYVYSNRFAHAVQQSGGTAATLEDGTSATAGDTPLWDAGLHGEGEVVGVGDSGLDHMSCYFYDAAQPLTISNNNNNDNPTHRKVVQYVPYASNGEDEDGGHGTHVAGSVAAKGTGVCRDIQDAGMAYEAKIAFFDIGQPNAQSLNVPPSLRQQFFPPSYDAGARIHTNSWGANTNRYTLNSRDVDAYSFDNQDYLVLVAAGNSGGQGTGSVGAPATAKSCMSIGASQSTTESMTLIGAGGDDPAVAQQHQVVADFSSLGPTADGRRGITLLAPGRFIISANSDANPTAGHTGLTVKAGTSMATPVTAGYAALVRQYFRSGYYPLGSADASRGFVPRGSLIEAMMVNSAMHMTGTFAGIAQNGARTTGRSQFNQEQRPSIVQGFGRFQLNRALRLQSSTGNWLSLAVGAVGDTASQVETGETKTFDVLGVDPTDGSGNNIALKVTLVWHDPASQTGAAKNLVNDLDLVVTNPSGQTILPQAEGDDSPSAQGAPTSKDSLNTVEQVVIANPTAGTYTISVIGTSIPQGPQPFAIVATWGTGTTTPEDALESNSDTISNGLGISMGGGDAKKVSAGEVAVIVISIIAAIAIVVVIALIVFAVIAVVVAKKRNASTDGSHSSLQNETGIPVGQEMKKKTKPKKAGKKKPPMPPKKRKPPKPPPKRRAVTVVAKWGYTATEDDELTFHEDDVITVLDTSDPDWHKGKLANGNVGMYPAAYVVPN